MELNPLARGPVAQLGARFHGMEEVVGSIPTRSTKSLQELSGTPPKPFARILPANGRIFPRDGTTVFFSPPSVVFCFFSATTELFCPDALSPVTRLRRSGDLACGV